MEFEKEMARGKDIEPVLLAALDSWVDGLLLVDEDGNALFANQSAYMMLGADQDLLAQRELIQQACRQPIARLRVIHDDGTERIVEVNAQVIEEEGQRYHLISLRDVTHTLREILNLTTLSHTDPLTGLLNRRGFLIESEARMRDAFAKGRGVGMLVCDLDDFKSINDRFGHAEGDIALQLVAARLRATLRGSDVVGRTGGDELVACVVGVDEVQLRELADRLTTNLNMAQPHYEVSASVGFVYAGPDSVESLEALLARADAHMYRAKDRKD